MESRQKILGRKFTFIFAANTETNKLKQTLKEISKQNVENSKLPVDANNVAMPTENDLEIVNQTALQEEIVQNKEPTPWPLPYKYLQEQTTNRPANEEYENVQLVSKTEIVETVNTENLKPPVKALLKIDFDDLIVNETQYIELFLKHMEIVEVWCRSGIYYFGFLEMGSRFPPRLPSEVEDIDIKSFPSWARKFLQTSSRSLGFSRKVFVLSLMMLFNLEIESATQLPHHGYITETISQMCLFCAILRTEQNLLKRNQLEETIVGQSVRVLYLATPSDRDIPICQMHFYRFKEKAESRAFEINASRAIHHINFQLQNKKILKPCSNCGLWIPFTSSESDCPFSTFSNNVLKKTLPIACAPEFSTVPPEYAFYAASGALLKPAHDYPMVESKSDLDIGRLIYEFLHQQVSQHGKTAPQSSLGTAKNNQTRDFRDNLNSYRILCQYLANECAQWENILERHMTALMETGRILTHDDVIRSYLDFNKNIADFLATKQIELFRAIELGYLLGAKLGCKKRLPVFQGLANNWVDGEQLSILQAGGFMS